VTIEMLAVEGMPEVRAGDDLGALVAHHAPALYSGDVLVVAQKVVSKAEGRLRALTSAAVTPRARELASRLNADARFIQLVLDESVRIVRADHVLIVETRQGFVCANAGVDRSNISEPDTVSLLPVDCDASAAGISQRLAAITGSDVAVIVSDTFGRPWRMGLVNVALGVAGMPALADLRGRRDDAGRPLHATLVAIADEVAAAAGLVMGKTRRIPAVIVRGLELLEGHLLGGRELVRPAELDLFR
jgi:coenzyme F420-0:L-glutamate ligase / coenzyme F420-1:gamma-L-glutamate ligase